MTGSTPLPSQGRVIDHVTAARVLAYPSSGHDGRQDWSGQTPRKPPWHPRITPYRFVVLSTTIGLGTAKAGLTQTGRTVVPITLEWIAGTALSLLLFSVSAYDARDPEDVPPYLSFLFKPDYMDIVWSILSFYSIPRPFYMSSERSPPPPRLVGSRHQDEPLSITAYRILVCLTVASFGMFKATVTYYGLPTAMTWIDWALAVPVTTTLYCLGLYEYNSSNMWPFFFVADLSEFVYSLKTGIVYTILISISVAWTFGFTHFLQRISNSPKWTILTDKAFFFSRLLAQDVLVAGIVVGALSFLLLVRLVLRDVMDRGGMIRRCSRVIRQVVFNLLRRIFLSLRHARTLKVARNQVSNTSLEALLAASPNPPKHHAAKFRLLLTIFIHIYIHLFGFIIALSFTALQFTSEPTWSQARASHLYPIGTFFAGLLWLLERSIFFLECVMKFLLIVFTISLAVLMSIPFFEKQGQLQERLSGLGPFEYLL